MRKYVAVLMLFFLAAVWLWGCGAPALAQEKPEPVEKVRAELLNKYGAVAFPELDVGTNRVFTYRLQELLMGSGRPVLFDGYLQDVLKERDELYVDFIAYLDPLAQEGRMVCHLKTSEDQIRAILENPPAWSPFSEEVKAPNFLVVGRIKTVVRTARPMASASWDEKGKRLQVRYDEFFILTGDLIGWAEYPPAD